MHVAACKEFYANLTVYLYKKKEVVRSRVRGVEIELDNMTLALILGIPGNNGICEYMKEVWEESKYIKPLEITRKFANDELINAHRRRDDEAEKVNNEGPAVNMENEEVNEEEDVLHEFDWEAVNEEAEIQGESGSAEKFYDAEDEIQGSVDVIEETPAVPAPDSVQ
ncbi:hypothetical protein Dimus_029583 [Dionaea muscipula]